MGITVEKFAREVFNRLGYTDRRAFRIVHVSEDKYTDDKGVITPYIKVEYCLCGTRFNFAYKFSATYDMVVESILKLLYDFYKGNMSSIVNYCYNLEEAISSTFGNLNEDLFWLENLFYDGSKVVVLYESNGYSSSVCEEVGTPIDGIISKIKDNILDGFKGYVEEKLNDVLDELKGSADNLNKELGVDVRGTVVECLSTVLSRYK